MDSYDVLIIGGGPAGSSCAWGLRESGLRVAILDKAVFPRDKTCGGWITPEVLSALEIDASAYSRDRMLQPITGFRVGLIGSSALETEYGKPVSYGIRRREFDDFLLRRCGADLLLGTALTSLKRDTGGWIVNDSLLAGLLVGAGGHFCPVVRLLAGKHEAEAPVVAQEVEFEMGAAQRAGCRVRAEMPELYFCTDMKGYGWCFRKGDFLNVGLGRADKHGLSAHVFGFVNFLKSAGRISFEIPPMHGHAYLLNGLSPRTVAGDGYLLVGDAAGLAHVQSGEGILPAIESGLRAAKSILAEKGFVDYQRALAAAPLTAAMKIGSALPAPVLSLVAGALLKTRWFVRNVVIGDWFLHRQAS